MISSDLAIHSLTINACGLEDEGVYAFTVANSTAEANLKVDGEFTWPLDDCNHYIVYCSAALWWYALVSGLERSTCANKH